MIVANSHLDLQIIGPRSSSGSESIGRPLPPVQWPKKTILSNVLKSNLQSNHSRNSTLVPEEEEEDEQEVGSHPPFISDKEAECTT